MAENNKRKLYDMFLPIEQRKKVKDSKTTLTKTSSGTRHLSGTKDKKIAEIFTRCNGTVRNNIPVFTKWKNMYLPFFSLCKPVNYPFNRDSDNNNLSFLANYYKNITDLKTSVDLKTQVNLDFQISYLNNTNPKCSQYSEDSNSELNDYAEEYGEEYLNLLLQKYLKLYTNSNDYDIFVDKYCPHELDDFFAINNNNNVEIYNFLYKQEDNNNNSYNDTFIISDSDSEGSIYSDVKYSGGTKLLILSGPNSSSKSTIISVCARLLNYNIIEINSNSNRSGRQILSAYSEASTSHHYNNSTLNAPNNKTLIVFEEVDNIFSPRFDKGFFSAIKTLYKISHIPIILTCNTIPKELNSRIFNSNSCKYIKYNSASASLLALHCHIIAYIEYIKKGTIGTCPALNNNIFSISSYDIYQLVYNSNFDYRKCLNHLQLYCLTLDTNFSIDKDKLNNGNNNNTPPSPITSNNSIIDYNEYENIIIDYNNENIDTYVQCDYCYKWRKTLTADVQGDSWECKYNNYGVNNCEFVEQMLPTSFLISDNYKNKKSHSHFNFYYNGWNNFINLVCPFSDAFLFSSTTNFEKNFRNIECFFINEHLLDRSNIYLFNSYLYYISQFQENAKKFNSSSILKEISDIADSLILSDHIDILQKDCTLLYDNEDDDNSKNNNNELLDNCDIFNYTRDNDISNLKRIAGGIDCLSLFLLLLSIENNKLVNINRNRLFLNSAVYNESEKYLTNRNINIANTVRKETNFSLLGASLSLFHSEYLPFLRFMFNLDYRYRVSKISASTKNDILSSRFTSIQYSQLYH